MKIKGWEKISGLTYKGYCIVNPIHDANEEVYYVVNPIHDANEEVYYATILNLNHQQRPKWDMILLDIDGVFTFCIKDNITKHPLAKAHLTKVNIETLQQFREQYEMLIEDILEKVQMV